jgi:hypothetical protein
MKPEPPRISIRFAAGLPPEGIIDEADSGKVLLSANPALTAPALVRKCRLFIRMDLRLRNSLPVPALIWQDLWFRFV